ncbi:MAG: cation-transporting P-type ATPase [Nanopusillaceae archaeon]
MWHYLDLNEIFEKLNTKINGLSDEEANERLKKYGYNEIILKKENVIIKTLKEKLKSAFVWLFISAFLLTLFLKSILEAFLILFMLFVYIIFDIINTYQAENIIEKLKKMIRQEVKVVRDGKEKLIDSKYLVPGDIVILKAGDKVPADIRLIEAVDLEVDESSLTGENFPVKKEVEKLPQNTPIYEMKNILFSGTYITKGYGKGVVVSTGKNTYLGSLYSKLYLEKEKKTILEEEIDKFASFISKLIVLLILIIFTVVVTTGYFKLEEAILFAIAVGIAVIPEGLPTALTIIYTYSIDKLKNKGFLVKKQSLIESLGSVDYIITDKTGTLTYNKHTVRKFWFNNKIYKVTGFGYNDKGKILLNDREADLEEIKIFLEVALNSVNTFVYSENNETKIVGDPLEAALIFLAKKGNYNKEYEKVKIFEFDSKRKRMSVISRKEDRYISYVKGAPESILEISKNIYINGRFENIEKYKNNILSLVEEFTKEGYRVLAIGYKELKNVKEDPEKEIVFLGIIAIEDPVRNDAIDAINFAKDSKIDVILITGDHPFTAVSVGKKIGLGEKYLIGEDIKNMSDDEILENLKNIKIIARADPEDKYRIVKIIKNKGYNLAFIGDGINDSLSIKVADIGISLNSGSDIAKEAAHAILLNDSFSSVIEAIKEGRKVYMSLKVFLIIILSLTLGIFSHILISFFTFSKIFLDVIAILVLNLAIETVYSIAIVGGEIEDKYLKKGPAKRMIDKETVLNIIRNSIFLGILGSAVSYGTKGNIFSIVLFFVLSRSILLFYYQIKYNISFLKKKNFYIALALSLLFISIFITPDLAKIINWSIPTIENILITGLVLFLFFIINLIILVTEYQSVPELHHQSANSDHHHNF